MLNGYVRGLRLTARVTYARIEFLQTHLGYQRHPYEPNTSHIEFIHDLYARQTQP